MKWFVMIAWPDGSPVPMGDIDQAQKPIDVCLFDSEDEAKKAADNNRMASAYGYEVYEWPEDH